jgi:hypothetical protein
MRKKTRTGGGRNQIGQKNRAAGGGRGRKPANNKSGVAKLRGRGAAALDDDAGWDDEHWEPVDDR